MDRTLLEGSYDSIVVGSGPNGLAAAICLAERGQRVAVVEARATPGGGMRSAELTLPGFVHDVCSAIHPLALASPFFRDRDLGIRFIHPDLPLAHVLDGGRAITLQRSVGETAQSLGVDAARYARLMDPLVERAVPLLDGVLGPLRIPRHPVTMARFALRGLRSMENLCAGFEGDEARALLAGLAAHSMLALDKVPTAAVGVVLGFVAHAFGWPLVAGGSQHIADALVERLEQLGGEVHVSKEVGSLSELPDRRAVLFDTGPRQLMAICDAEMPTRYRRSLGRFRYGPGVFKLDWALEGEVPWSAPDAGRAGTVHVGGTFEEVALSESEVSAGRVPGRPFVLVAQQSVFDGSRAPMGKQTLWAYCHVPNGCTVDMTDRIEAQIERFAPGFRDRIIARHATSPSELNAYNANYVGGDINGGIQDLRQLFTRPTRSLTPYATPMEGIYLCSSSTPPGGGVHGMCGYHAARVALRRM